MFDFNADGRAEVVYGDECFVRVYDGRNGEAVFSQGHFSYTWLEYITIADPDGDGSAEMIVGSSDQCRTDGYCPAIDPIHAGVACETNEDCVSGSCDQGYCRCTNDAECPATYSCAGALEGTPGTGDVCRAQHAGCHAGIRVFRDNRDRWASSRTIWNQHAYHVTNVEDDGTIVGSIERGDRESVRRGVDALEVLMTPEVI
ncbi:Hypothetical protein I5071_360 (plasmid) [Sandaracinus amylolyticus]|uniref:FG-GAP repeat domain-containing protein n=1 Tax=Sandaracinus sp. TaxID=2024858 RepID=UPI0019D49A41|nr:VCBS repeat-containing protein [Sandaracinus sp.]QRN75747.1 FG-GAP repeat-HVR domain-containing protein [Sandaracinus sp.]UJR87244.1 Hypothetical protein I5071_360 [Sandaracinus amylolyticus]